MSTRKKKKRAPDGVRPDWWEYPTFMTYGAGFWPDQMAKTVKVELILPDGNRVNLGRFPAPQNHDELRQAVAERFKEIWDPEKRCRRSEQT